jgi:Chromo (CHRromatin Organisation MOdifier) domain
MDRLKHITREVSEICNSAWKSVRSFFYGDGGTPPFRGWSDRLLRSLRHDGSGIKNKATDEALDQNVDMRVFPPATTLIDPQRVEYAPGNARQPREHTRTREEVQYFLESGVLSECVFKLITDDRVTDKGREYKVHWRGLSDDLDKWVHKNDIDDGLLYEYQRRRVELKSK